MTDCLFCQIADDPAQLVWQSDTVVAFKDKFPKAPVHVLVVPRRHVARLDDLDDPALGGQLFEGTKAVAFQAGLKGAYQVHINNGRAAGQVIDHLHLHVMGGETDVRTADIG